MITEKKTSWYQRQFLCIVTWESFCKVQTKNAKQIYHAHEMGIDTLHRFYYMYVER